jgi:DNA-binding response OmpR family regulator
MALQSEGGGEPVQVYHGKGLAAKILLISDEPVAAKIWEYTLKQAGVDTLLISVNDPVLELWSREMPDLIVVEDFNDEIEELGLCKKLRAAADIPLLMLTNKPGEAFQLKAYRAGVDECIPLPVTPRLFQAKVQAWLRRARSIPLAALDEVRVGRFVLNAGQKRLTLPSQDEVRLTVLESRVLFLLMNHPDCVFSPEDVIEKVWGSYGNGDNALLKNLVYRLRKKIEPNPSYPQHILNERNTGYKFHEEVG